MPKSVLDAIKMGLWDYEPPDMKQEQYEATDAMSGTAEKLDVMAHRIRDGLPLWHPSDRDDVEVVRPQKPR